MNGSHHEEQEERQPLSSLSSHWPAADKIISKILKPVGFEASPFHIGWYNELVGPKFYLDYPENTLGVVICSGPDTFEKCVIPFVKSQTREALENPKFDPLDGSMTAVFRELTRELELNDFEVDTIQDFHMHPSRKPKVLVQTAAHVAGAVEYFHRDRMTNQPALWLNNSKLFGVAIHPSFGGWFAIRGVVILKNCIPDSENVLPKPPRPFPSIENFQIIKVLEEFATNWKRHIWRDVLPRKSDARYSDNFIRYLDTEPDKRWEFVKSLAMFDDGDDSGGGGTCNGYGEQ